MISLDRPAHRVARPPARWWRWSERGRGIFETALIVAGFIVLFLYLPHHLRGDDYLRLTEIDALLNHGRLTSSRFSLIMPLASVPVLLLGDVTRGRNYWAAHFNVIVVATGVLVAYFMLRRSVDARLFRLVVLVLLFASFLTNRLRDYNAEVFTATLVTLGIICLVARRRTVLGWAAIVLGVVNTPATIVGLALLAVAQTVRTRQLRNLLPLGAAAALILGEAWLRRGSPFSTGYEGQPGFSYPFVLGLVSILFSFGRGLLFFTPGVFLAVSRRVRALLPRDWRTGLALMLTFLAGMTLVYSKWWAWYGGLAWGPRFFVFAAIPAAVLVGVTIWQAGRSPWLDLVALLVLAVSAWVGFAGAIADLRVELGFCRADHHLAYCWFTPDYSSLWQPIRQFPHLTTATAIVAAFCCVVYAYLAAPLVFSLFRSVRPARSWVLNWRI